MTIPANLPRNPGVELGRLARAKNWLGSLHKRLTVSMVLSVCLHLAVAGVIALVLIYFGGVEELFRGGELNVRLMDNSGQINGTDGNGGTKNDPKKKDEDKPEPTAEAVKLDQAALAQAAEKAADQKLQEVAQAAEKADVSKETKKAQEEAQAVMKRVAGEISDGLRKDHERAARSEKFIDEALKGPTPEVAEKAKEEKNKLDIQDAELLKREGELREMVRRIDAMKAQKAQEAYAERMAERARKAAEAQAEWEARKREIQAKAEEAAQERDERIAEIKAAAAQAETQREAKRQEIQRKWAQEEAKRQAAIAARNEQARQEAEARKADLESRQAEADAANQARLAEVRRKIEAAAAARAERVAKIKADAERAARERAAKAAQLEAQAHAEREAERKRVDALAQKANQRSEELQELNEGKLSWDDAVGLLSKDGLDIVIVFDSTESMGAELAQLKANIARIGRGLKQIIPKTRISICTYRDLGDNTPVQGQPLSDDIEKVESYLGAITIGAGGDRPEAVQEGLRWAVTKNQFASDARKVILVFGDEPPHPQDLRTCESIARSFRIQQHGTVSMVTCIRQTGQPALTEFNKIAEAGGGESTPNADSNEIVRQLVRMIFPKPYRNKVDSLIP